MWDLISAIKELNHERVYRRLLRKHRRQAELWRRYIEDYYQGKVPKYKLLPKKPELVGKRVVWQYWGQSLDRATLPEVTRISFDSIDHYCREHQVIRLSDETVSDYVDMPPVILEALSRDPYLSRSVYSDLLRLALLEAYGGVWLDATIYLDRELDPWYWEQDFFVFQRDPEQSHKRDWHRALPFYCSWDEGFMTNMLSSVFFAQPGSEVVSTLFDLLCYYWQERDPKERPIMYLFFQVLFDLLVRREEAPLHQLNCPVRSNADIESLQLMALGRWPEYFPSIEEVLRDHPIQKLSNRVPHSVPRLKQILQEAGRL